MTSRSRRSRRIMRSSIQAMNDRRDGATKRRRDEVRTGGQSIQLWCRACAGLSLVLAGCAHIPNQFVEDSPASGGNLESDTARDLYANRQRAPYRERGW